MKSDAYSVEFYRGIEGMPALGKKSVAMTEVGKCASA